MKIILFSPPLISPKEPYAALPVLKAFIEQHGHQVILKDANIQFFDKALSSDYLESQYRIIKNKLKEFSRKRMLADDEKANYNTLKTIVGSAPYVINHVDSAKKILRNKGKADKSCFPGLKELWSLWVLKSGLEIIEACYFPTRFTFTSVEFKMRYSVSSCEEILRAVECKNENVFLDFFKENLIPEVITENPGLVGISINDENQIIPGLTLAKLIKDAGIYVVIGGAIFTKELLIKKEFFCLCDSFVRSDGEFALLELIKQLEGNEKSFSKVPNLVWLDKLNKDMVINNIVNVADLDVLPTQNFDGLKLNSYFGFYTNTFSFPLAISRGCYWNKCGFCDIAYERKYRERSVHLVVKDITTVINKYKLRTFFFTGECLHPGFLRDLAKAIIESKLNIKWSGYIRAEEEFTEELCGLLEASGCEKLFIGVESGSQRILDLVNKGTKLSIVEAVLSNLFKAKIAVAIYVIAGFPTETKSDALETFNFILKNKNNLESSGFYLYGAHLNCRTHSLFFTNSKDYKIDNIIVRDDKDNLETRNKYTIASAGGLTYNEAKKTAREWCNSVRGHFFYYGMYNILIWNKAQNVFFSFPSILIKLALHSVKYNINRYAGLLRSNFLKPSYRV